MTSLFDRTPIEWILAAGAKATGVSRRLLRSKWRHRSLHQRRRFIARKMRDEGYSYWEIARALGRRSHQPIVRMLRTP